MDFNTAVARMIMCMNDDCGECPYRSLGDACQCELCKECTPVIHSVANTQKKPENLYDKVTRMCISIGVPPHTNGFNYIRSAVVKLMDHPEKLNQMHAVLYKEIAEEFNTRVTCVERSIRHAIEIAF